MATSSVLASGASGAAMGSAFGPWGTAIGAGLGVAGGLLSASAEKKAAAAKAAALEKQAQRRLAQGQSQSLAIKGQGQMDQTTQATRMISSGGATRTEAAADSSLAEIANRAQNESVIALQNAEYDAQNIREDINAINQDSRSNQTAAYINAATTILGAAGNYNKNNLAAKYALQNSSNGVR